ncbi:MAG: hypothetical protein WCO94_16695, partial [Verrucomicrobiota bacterium]
SRKTPALQSVISYESTYPYFFDALVSFLLEATRNKTPLFPNSFGVRTRRIPIVPRSSSRLQSIQNGRAYFSRMKPLAEALFRELRLCG